MKRQVEHRVYAAYMEWLKAGGLRGDKQILLVEAFRAGFLAGERTVRR